MSDRFFSSTPIEFTASGDTLVRLEATEAHHLMHGMRRGVGARVTLCDGSGAEFTAEVKELSRRDAVLAVLSREEISREPPVEIHLVVAMPKGDRQKVLVEKLTELGVARLTPVVTDHGVVELRASALQKLRRAVIEASKQCGRNRLMQIDEPQPLNDFLKADLPAERLIAHPGGEPLGAVLSGGPLPGASTMLVGPEGGFSEAEVQQALASGWRQVSLGGSILRIETAAISLAATRAILGRSG